MHVKSSSAAQDPLIVSENDTGQTANLYAARSANPLAAGKTILESGQAQDILLNPSGGNVGIATTAPMATLDVGGTARLATYSVEPVVCDQAHSGTIALNHLAKMCICDGTQWLFVRNDISCDW